VSEKRFNFWQWRALKRVPQLLELRPLPPERQLARIRVMERDIALPVKAAIILVLFQNFFFSNWLEIVIGSSGGAAKSPHEVVLGIVPPFLLAYLLINAGVATLLLGMHHFSLPALQRLVFVSCLTDAVFFAALTLITDGFESFLYWVFLALIMRNTVSIPSAPWQFFLNLGVSASYLLAGMVDYLLKERQYSLLSERDRLSFALEPATSPLNEPFLLRLSLLVLMTVCCYGVQVLMEKQRRADDESREYTMRQEQLQAAGRLAAEIAHQLKNPLGVINNAAYTLQKTVREGKTITQQIKIIREEVDRSDRILTELMGYARLSEGQVEKLDITEELDRAIDQVFPPGTKYDIAIKRNYGAALPTLLAQRGHLSEVFVNLLQNAREAIEGEGEISVSAEYGDNYSVTVTIADNGPGIPAEKLPKVFEAYFTTKEKGTGLGLAIVKHNTELYNGTVEVQSEPGKGATFVVKLPARTVFTLRT
jgi:signal transduction histidine kinase